VHGRTRADLYEGEAEYGTIAAIKAAISIPVFANGDIDTPQKARAVLDATKADAVMIGRAAQGRPWIFREVAHYLATGETLPEPGAAEVGTILCDHLERLYAFYGEHQGVRIARKHLGWYAKGRSGNAAFRETANRATTADEQLVLTRRFFGIELAAAA
jgi:tRNA-dihydrouridine synthase B